MKRYAFIDVQNTATTTEKILHFMCDWHKVVAAPSHETPPIEIVAARDILSPYEKTHIHSDPKVGNCPISHYQQKITPRSLH
jgi:hypothetical protein